MSEKPPASQTAPDDWDAHWRELHEAASENPAQQMRHQIVRDLLARDATAHPIARICDFGSGQGDLAAVLSRAFPAAAYTGLEISAAGVEVSRRKVPTARFEVADLFADTPDRLGLARWGTHAVCSEVLEHVDDPAEFLRRCRPFLAPGATLIITVPGGPMSAFDRHIGHRTHFTRASIAEVLTTASFEVERTYAAGFPFFNLYRLTVILRGERLASDVSSTSTGAARRAASLAMSLFRQLFRANLLRTPLGWQVVACARNPG